MKKIILKIEGMTCSACSSSLEKYLLKQEGINDALVNLVMSSASISYEDNITEDDLNRFISEAGFKSLGIYDEQKENVNPNKNKYFLVNGLIALLVLYISMSHMFSLPTISFLNMINYPINYSVCLFIFSIYFIYFGKDILISGLKNLKHKSPNMDTLVMLGVASSFILSTFNMFMILKGHNEYVENLYFESAAIVIFFIKLGRYIDGISKDKTKEAIQKLVQITPKEAIVKVNGEEKKVTIDEIKKGDIVVSKPGEKIAVDGKIITGKAHLDESFITGESKPASKTEGSKVIAGSINYDGYIEYEAEKIGKESTISEIVRLVIEATNTKAPIAKVADTVSGYFVPAVILIAIITFIAYLILGNTVATAINAFVTILVVACPCSLGLATPLAIVVSEGVCANNGILVKKSEILENAEKTTTVVFDKTGTLTYGKLKIAQIINYSKMQEKELMQIVGSLEKKSAHPIGKAFEDYLNENKIETLDVKDFKDVSGYGIIGKIAENEVILGNYKILDKYDVKNSHKQDEEKLAKEGNSIIYVVLNNEISAIIGVNDIVRENSKEVISKLNKNKIETVMLTGDNTLPLRRDSRLDKNF